MNHPVQELDDGLRVVAGVDGFEPRLHPLAGNSRRPYLRPIASPIKTAHFFLYKKKRKVFRFMFFVIND